MVCLWACSSVWLERSADNRKVESSNLSRPTFTFTWTTLLFYFPEPSKCLAKVTDTNYETLDKFFPVAGWSTSFKTNNWKGFVFGPPEL